MDRKKFIEKAVKIHGNKYDYSKIEYKGAKEKVCIICPSHGEFWQTPDKHLNAKQGCPKCKGKQFSTEERIIQFTKIHGDKYDYSKVKYVNNTTKICIICPRHGEFWQTPANHLKGKGCKLCRDEKLSMNRRSNNKEFIEKAKKIHGNDYSYDKIKYVNNVTPIEIVCPIHGSYWQKPIYHLDGCGCPECSNSSLEREFKNILIENNIKFIHTANKKDLPWIGLQHLDFYLPEYNVAIECQGRQHFISDDYFGGDEKFKLTLERDLRKYNLCKKNNVKLYYYTASNCMKYENKFQYYSNNLYDSKETIINKIKHIV